MIGRTCPDDHRHGAVRTCYSRHACRCEDCKRGNAEYVRNRKRGLVATPKSLAYTKPGVATKKALVEVTLSARDAEMVAGILADRARRIRLVASNAGVQAPVLRTRATSIDHLAHLLSDAAEQITG